MPVITNAFRNACAAATLLALTGCYHYPYNPYHGYGPTYAPQYGAPAQPGPYLSPGGPTYIPQNITPGPGSSGAPTLLTPTPGSPTPNWKPPQPSGTGTGGSGSDAPTYQPNPNREVPPGQDVDDFFKNSAPSGAAKPGNQKTSQLPVFSNSSLAASAPPAVMRVLPAAAQQSEDPFAEPGRLPANDSSALPMNTPSLNPYSFDGQAYTWVRGIVDFDDTTRTWSIVYNLTPDAADAYSGSFVLTAHPDLGTLQRGDVALLEGRIDPKQRDRTGKPLYAVTKVTPLQAP